MMKINRLLPVFFLFLIASTSSFSQNLSGIWRGYFITNSGEQYKYEVQLDQSKKNSLSGVTYSYLDTRFYGKATFTGNFTQASGAALVQEIKTVELKMAGGSVACIMKCRMVYSRSGKEEFLEGIYSSSYEKTDAFNGVKRGGDCGGGKVYLRKVPTSDFYVEPFLRDKKTTQEPPKEEVAKTTPPKKPETKTTTTGPKKTEPKKDPVVKKPAEKPAVIEPENKKGVDDVIINSKPVERKTIQTPTTIRDRKNELTKTIVVNNNEVEISLYDNGEIDDDTISIYLDGKLIMANKRLSSKPLTYKLKMEDTNEEHTLVMVAENLGRIPPNTSLMMIQDGDKRYQVSITSTEQKNAMVRFRYEKKG
jgi:hypothetical protein